MSSDPHALTRSVLDACLAMGFACAGVAKARPTSMREHVLAWLNDGKHAEMAFMTEQLDQRLDVTVLLPGAQSVLIVADQYAGDERPAPPALQAPPASDAPPAVLTGRIARYARGQDYHALIRSRLHALADRLRKHFPTCECRTFVDTGPVLEREHAVRAGLGFIGKHTLLISPQRGSWLLLGGLATTLELEPTEPATSSAPSVDSSRCGSCTRCIDACPTNAISPWSVDARRCVSYLTLEHSSCVDEHLWHGLGNHLIGCDICQDVCPFNRPVETEQVTSRQHNAYRAAPGRDALALLEVLNWTEDDRRRVLAGSAGKRATLDMIRRSAIINAANMLHHHADAALLDKIRSIAADDQEPEVIQATARHALLRLSSRELPPP